MTTTTTTTTDWDAAPSLMDGALSLSLTAEDCNLTYWIENVAQGTWAGLVNGHRPGAEIPHHIRQDGPLRQALIEEFGFRSVGEEIAARVLGMMAAHAPDIAGMEFYITQSLDEARHGRAFRSHILELGLSEAKCDDIVQSSVGDYIERILRPLERWAFKLVRDERDYIAGVVIITILAEGVLSPAAEISERKWRPIDQAAADIERTANIDEIRHLVVGESIIRKHLEATPSERSRLIDLVVEGRQLWAGLPTHELILHQPFLKKKLPLQ
ncbi:MAG: VlmB-like protein, partial [Myxococcota bacterium]